MAIKLIAFDLDFTLLDSQKRISEDNLRTLARAAEMGVYIVPATGRIFSGLPAEVKALPGMRYCILGNGTRIYDAKEDKIIASQELPIKNAVELFDFADSLGLYSDCYAGENAWMEREVFENLDDYFENEATKMLLRAIRKPVENMREFLLQNYESVLKVQLYFKDLSLRRKLLKELPERFPTCAFSSSIPENIEICSVEANKGIGLHALCEHLGLDISETIAFGDGLNDLEMIECAGIGVAMANAEAELKKRADYITTSCDESGIARALEHFLL